MRSSIPRRLSRRVGSLSLFSPHFPDQHILQHHSTTTTHPAFRDHHLDAPCAYRSPAFPRRASDIGLLLNQQNCQRYATAELGSTSPILQCLHDVLRQPTCYRAQLETEHDVLTGVSLTECRNSKECAPAKHHYDECVARVTGGTGAEGEDCVEECTFI